MSSERGLLPGWLGMLMVLLVWGAFALGPGYSNQVKGEGMLPLLAPGDLLLMHPAGVAPQRGDLVVLRPTPEQSSMDALPDRSNGQIIARVIGLPGDKLAVRHDGFIINHKDRISVAPGPYWMRYGGSLQIPGGGHFALGGGNPTDWSKNGGASQYMGMFDIQQIRVVMLHVPRTQVMDRAALGVIGGGGLVSVMIWALWFSGRYCRPLLPLRMILGLSWFALLVVLAGYLMAPHTGAQPLDPRLGLAGVSHQFFSGIGIADWLLRLFVVFAMMAAVAIVTWRVDRSTTGETDNEPSQPTESKQSTELSSFRLWPVVFGILAILHPLAEPLLTSRESPMVIVVLLVAVVIPATFWQLEISALKPKASRFIVWPARLIRALRLCGGVLGLLILAKLVIAASDSVFGVIGNAFMPEFQAKALGPLLWLLYGLPGVRPAQFRVAVRNAFNGPANPLRVGVLLAIFLGLSVFAYIRSQPNSFFRDEYRIAAEMIAHARPATEDFFTNEYRLPDELDTDLMFGSLPSMRGVSFVGPGILRLSIPRTGRDDLRIFLIFEGALEGKYVFDYRCVHDEEDFSSKEPALRRCIREPGFNSRNHGSRRSLIARTPRAADGPTAETRIYFRVGGSAKSDMGPAMLPPPSRKNPEAARYVEMLETDVRKTVFPGGNSPREIELVGFADATGPESGNQVLSALRVETAKAYLVELGVPISTISTRAAGEEPIPPECSASPRLSAECFYRSRRVEIRVWQ